MTTSSVSRRRPVRPKKVNKTVHTTSTTAHGDPDVLLPLPPLTLHIMVALSRGDRQAYQIMREVQKPMSGVIPFRSPSLHHKLARMCISGLISEADGYPPPSDARRRYYRLTDWGRAVVEAEGRRLSEIVSWMETTGLLEYPEAFTHADDKTWPGPTAALSPPAMQGQPTEDTQPQSLIPT